MTNFVEYIEIMKNMFETFDEYGKVAAIDQVDEFLNWMSYKWQSEQDHPGFVPVLLQNAEEMIMDRFGEEWEMEHIQPIEQQNMVYYQDIPEDHNVPSTSYADNKPLNSPLLCFTCGMSAKNEKALYRHGVRFAHQIRPLSKNGKMIGRKFKKKSEIPLKKEEPANEDSLPRHILEGEEEEEEEEDQEVGADSNSYNCLTCGTLCKNRKALYRHGIRFKHKTRDGRSSKSKGGRFKCELCVDYSTTRAEYLRRHKKRQHNSTETTPHIEHSPVLINGSE